MLLKFLPTFGYLSGLSVIGLLILVFRKNKDLFSLLGYFCVLLAILSGILVSFAHGRYRMPLAALLGIPVGAVISLIVNLVKQKKFLLSFGLILTSFLVSLPSFLIAPPRIYILPKVTYEMNLADSILFDEQSIIRPYEYTKSAVILWKAGEKNKAIKYLENIENLTEDLVDNPPSGLSWLGEALLYQGAGENFKNLKNACKEIGLSDKVNYYGRKSREYFNKAGQIFTINNYK